MKRLLLSTALCLGIATPGYAAPLMVPAGASVDLPASATNPIPITRSGRVTYSANTGFFTPVATPTDVFVIEGSATKTLKIQRIVLNCTQTTAGINKWFLNKHSTANTAGAATNTAVIPHLSTDAASTAVSVKHYTANPTVGTSLGSIATRSILAPAPASTAVGGYFILYDTDIEGRPITLSGVAEGLALNFAGAAVPAGLDISIGITWTEE